MRQLLKWNNDWFMTFYIEMKKIQEISFDIAPNNMSEDIF